MRSIRQRIAAPAGPTLLATLLAGLLIAPASPLHANEFDSESTPANTTSTLKRYSSAEFDFSFDYPNTFTLMETRGSETNDALFIVKLLSLDENIPIARERTPGSFSVEVFANPRRLRINEWLDENGWPFGTERNATSIRIANTPALDVTTGRMFAPNHFIYIATDTHVLRLSPTARESASITQSFKLTR